MFTAADFSKEQNDLIQSRKRRILVDAGAGSGKTRTLIGRIVSLLEGNTAAERRGRVDLSRIVLPVLAANEQEL
ncbi:MAG TPA: UvrD-helicase domain-containing protein, partial [Candidatus Hydrogenedentes bacterium]|nr:UvrD-helicase domain-containing protein [Candidatus Hydrogenedentota bacterium]